MDHIPKQSQVGTDLCSYLFITTTLVIRNFFFKSSVELFFILNLGWEIFQTITVYGKISSQFGLELGPNFGTKLDSKNTRDPVGQWIQRR